MPELLVNGEDVLGQWPIGPLATVGRPAQRVDAVGRARAR
jgi:hypothetical protein